MNSLFTLLISILCLPFTTPCIAQDEWKNPEITVKLKPRERAIKQYPPKPHTKKTQEDVKGFYEFGNRMADMFSASGMTISEATIIYQIIAEGNIVRHESYGMPSPGQTISKLGPEDLKKIVSVKKIEEGLFELFYSYYGCGTNYVRQAIIVEDGKIIGKSKIEKWSGSYPC